MRDYVIFADSTCDISEDVLKEWGIPYCSLTFRFTGENKEYNDRDIDSKAFYDRMRKGEVAKTAAVNSQTFVNAFEEIIKEGRDVLYIAFSSGLSTTYNSGRIAGEELSAKYPEAKIRVVDSLSASAGYGLLLSLAVDMKKSGKDIDEVAKYVEETRLNICHWFTVDDLVYLKRGGRVSATAAFVGNVLGIKPVMHMDNEGHLINVSKVRGRKTSLMAIADKYGELALDKKDGRVYICHADCMNDVEELKRVLNERYGAKVEIVTDTGTVIGSHSGPGTIALFFVGKER